MAEKRTPQQQETSYAQAVQRLDSILETIEGGQADIDELSGLVEEAAELLELCREKITQADMKVRSITQRLEEEPPASPPPTPDRTEEDGHDVPF